MARPRTKCCPTPSEPSLVCNPTVTPDGQHPSLGSTRAATIGSNPTTETLTFGCSAQPALTVGAFGRHRFEFPVQVSAAGPWRAYFVVWFDSPTGLDPSVVGSLSLVNWSTSLKVRLAEGWTDAEDAPQLLAGIALEQAGTKYFTAPATALPVTLYGFNPCCWQLLQAVAQDEYCTEPNFTMGIHRADSDHRSTVGVEHVASNPYHLVGDWFGEMGSDGVPNDDLRPRLDLYDTTPVDRFGAVFCLSGEVAGDFRIVAQLSPICGTVHAHGSYRTDGPNNAPAVPGTQIINEPLDAGIPAGWTATSGIWMNEDGSHPLYGGAGGSWSTRDAMTLYESIAPWSGEYLAGVAYIPFTLPSLPPFSETFQITAEVTWRRINDQDRRYLFTERPGGVAPTDRLHSQECGILLAPFGKVTLAHQLGYDGVLTSNSVLRVSQAITEFSGGLGDTWNLYPHKPYGWPCPCEDLPDPSYCDGQEPDTGSYGTNPSITYYAACDGAIEDGTRLAVILKRYGDLSGGGCIGDDWKAFRYYFEVWINGRSMRFAPFLGDTGFLGYTWSTNVVKIGLVAHFGGAWTDLKVWHQP